MIQGKFDILLNRCPIEIRGNDTDCIRGLFSKINRRLQL
ncbi:hypothetical protein KR49_00160 [Synechococcus sp. KORDI-49]|nr:hypothetical protein KR49_00160 [Synechococcus sp. KORDI-49]